MRIYAAWSPEYILTFSSDNTHYDQGETVGYMQPRKLSQCPTAPSPDFNSPKGSTEKYLYHNNTSNPPTWQDTSGYETGSVNWYRFTHWVCAIGNKRHVLKQGDQIDVHVFNIDYPPIMSMCAYWERAYDRISFKIEGQTYCEVCIDTSINRVEYPPHDPEITTTSQDKRMFQGWDVAEGDYLPGVDRSALVICGTAQQPLVEYTDDQNGPIICPSSGDNMSSWELVCGTTGTIVDPEMYSPPIVCKEEEIDYSIAINAYLIEKKQRIFNVVFKYKDDTGHDASHTENVV